jgi:cysteine desulfurase/selenocysteine lyase
VRVTDEGSLDLEDYREKLSPDTVAVAFPAISNVTGAVNPVKEMTELAHGEGALVVLDGAQWLPHRSFDVSDCEVDFLTFSAHKMLGPTGLGVLYGRAELLERMPPPFGGGEMILKVTHDEVKWNELPRKFEPGTPPIAQVFAFGSSLDYLEELGMEEVRDHVEDLTDRAVAGLSKVPGLKIYGPKGGEPRGGLVSFTLEGVHPHDVAAALDSIGDIAIRAGLHCAQPLHEVMGLAASARASFYVYNTRGEVDSFIDSVEETREILGGPDE